MIQDVFHIWQPTFLVNDQHAIMLCFFIPTERLWAFELDNTAEYPVYSQHTYTEYMFNKLQLEEEMQNFYDGLKKFFDITIKIILYTLNRES